MRSKSSNPRPNIDIFPKNAEFQENLKSIGDETPSDDTDEQEEISRKRKRGKTVESKDSQDTPGTQQSALTEDNAYKTKARQKKSACWEFLDLVKDGGNLWAVCKLCKDRMKKTPTTGTTTFNRHVNKCKIKHGLSNQTQLQFEGEQSFEVTISRRGEHNSRGGEHGNTNDDSVAKMAAAAEALEKKEKQKPSFELSGKLAEETNRFRGITLLFNEAPDARKPDTRWRLYVFKGGDVLNEPLYVHRQTSYLFGRERRVADIPTDHPSCSKQHAVLQYRQVETEQPDGTLSKQVKPYIMDLGSTNGTFINEERIDPQRYYELREKDTIKFGNSSREYVLLHENSAG